MGKWEMMRLGDVCEVVSGSTPSTRNDELWDGDIKWIAPAEISDDSYFIYDTVKRISEKAGLKPMPTGTVLLSSRAPIGKVAIAGTEMCCNQGFKNLICSEKIHNRYLYRYLKNQTEYLNSLGRGATFKEISKAIVENVTIPLPPLEVQRQIADVLDCASALIEKRKTQIAKLDLLVKSQFIEMFGDPVTNPKGWEVETLGNHLKVIGGYAFKSTGYKQVGIPVLRIGNINTGVLTLNDMVFWNYDKRLERYIMFPNDLVISLTGTVGKDDYANVCILPAQYPQYYLNQRNAKLDVFGTLNNCYLLYLFRNKEVKKRLTGISRGIRQANISNSDILNLCVPIPPKSLQEEFSVFVERVEAQKSLLQKSLAELEINYKSLMQKCFRGEVF